MTMIPVKDAAERFGVSPQTMRTWCKDGHVPGAVQEGRKWMVPEDAVPEGVRLPSRPVEVPDTSELRPKTDEEIAALLDQPGTYDNGGRFSQGMDPTVVSRGFAEPELPDPEPAAEEPVTLAEVRESLTGMREALNTLGSLAGGLYDQVCATLDMVELLGAGENDNSVPSPPDLVPGKDGPLLDDAQALEYLASGQSTVPTLDGLDEVADAEPEVEIDTDPREAWEQSEALLIGASHE